MSVQPDHQGRAGWRAQVADIAEAAMGGAPRYRELERLAAFYGAVLDTVIDAIITIDESGVITMANPAAERMFGYPVDELVGANVSMLMPEPDRGRHDDYLLRYLATGDARIIGTGREIKARRRDGSIFPADLGISEVQVEGETRFFTGILRDATERHESQELLRHQALHDGLTGLPNRVLFADHLDGALARAQRSQAGIGVLFIDLDRFKNINDSLGHAAGDELLRQAGRRLKKAVRPADTVARLGGDEFGVLVEDPRTPPAVFTVAERIHRLFQHPFDVEGQELRCTVSIGIAHAGDGADNGPDLLRHADAALYLAKERGRDRYEVFDEPMRTRLHARLRNENELHRALELGHVEAHYQPIIDLRDDSVVAFEALARWRHPERGLLVGSEFIPLAEETGLIVPVGQRVIDLVCREHQTWAKAFGDDVPDVTINLSSREVAASGLRALADRPPHETRGLWVELTESALLQDVDNVVADLTRVREQGIRVAIDDFGIGYSSLSRLRHFPADALKIDKSFIAGLGQDERDTAVVTAITRLAESLGISTVAEGVETEEQLELLRRLGCNYAQGFAISPVLPAGAVEDAVRSRR